MTRALRLVSLSAALSIALISSASPAGAGPRANASAGQTGQVALELGAWQHIRFDKTPPTRYRTHDGQLWADVSRSASFLLLPFEAPRNVRQVKFEWQLDGQLATGDARAEEARAGDDMPLRIGLLVSGPEPSGFLGLGVPGWLKQVRGQLKHETNRLLFLMAGSAHSAGARWNNPRSDDVEQLAVLGPRRGSGWLPASASFSRPVAVVGLWIMADGDDTRSTFKVGLRNLTLR